MNQSPAVKEDVDVVWSRDFTRASPARDLQVARDRVRRFHNVVLRESKRSALTVRGLLEYDFTWGTFCWEKALPSTLQMGVKQRTYIIL
jgi:hypothetical protein